MGELPWWLSGKKSTCNARAIGDVGSIFGLGRSPGELHGNALQYSCLENPWTDKPGRLLSIRLQRVRHDWTTFTSLLSCFTKKNWESSLALFSSPSPCSFNMVFCNDLIFLAELNWSCVFHNVWTTPLAVIYQKWFSWHTFNKLLSKYSWQECKTLLTT